MNSIEKAELNEIRQVFDDALIRADRAYSIILGNDDLAHVIKAMVHIKRRLKNFSEGRIRKFPREDVHKTNHGEWP